MTRLRSLGDSRKAGIETAISITTGSSMPYQVRHHNPVTRKIINPLQISYNIVSYYTVMYFVIIYSTENLSANDLLNQTVTQFFAVSFYVLHKMILNTDPDEGYVSAVTMQTY